MAHTTIKKYIFLGIAISTLAVLANFLFAEKFWPAAITDVQLSISENSVNIPTSLSLVVVSTAEIDASWSDNGNPAGTNYYVENTTAGTNSGWIENLTWSSVELECNTTYSFRVKSRNAIQTAESSFTAPVTAKTNSCPITVPTAGSSPEEVRFSPIEVEENEPVEKNENKGGSTMQNLIDSLKIVVQQLKDFVGMLNKPSSFQKQTSPLQPSGEGDVAKPPISQKQSVPEQTAKQLSEKTSGAYKTFSSETLIMLVLYTALVALSALLILLIYLRKKI